MDHIFEEFILSISSLNLSPLEKIMLVYDRIKKYDINSIDDNIKMTELFNKCMQKLGYKSCVIESLIDEKKHAHVIINVDDDKYDVHGIYHFDPSSDCLLKNESDRSISYNFFCRNRKEMNSLKQPRIMSGLASVIMGQEELSALKNENPFKTLEVVNVFSEDEDAINDLKFLNEYRQDVEKNHNYWPTINKKYELSISFLRDKVGYAKEVPLSVITQVIINVRKITNKEFKNEDIEDILMFNNEKFSENFSDPRLLFKINPKNYVSKDNYKKALEEITYIYDNKKDSDTIKTNIDFTNGQQQQVLLKITLLSSNKEEILLDYTFDDNYEFATNFLTPLIQLYSDRFSYKFGKIEKPEYLNFQVRDYKCESNNGNLFSITNCQLGYLQKVDSFLKSNSIELENQVEKSSSKQKTYKKEDGFANAILLAHITGIALGLIFMAIYLFIR